ncbi:MAG: ABC transporter ATP-binding protein [Chloroflexi bacterium]|nr:ABC transporter ATP-binding protein [Chloroflexota bacterium]
MTKAVGGPQVEARGLTRAFRGDGQEVVALRDVDLDVLPGEFLAVMGRSGSGKTTLLHLLAGLDRPTSGTVRFQGRDLATMSEGEMVALRRHRIGFVFQSFGLLPLLSAYENVELPLRINGLGWRERRRRAGEALAAVGLAARAQHRPSELSGGEQQRVAIARALAVEPAVIFADEPTGKLDLATGLAIGELLRQAVRERRVAVVAATHDPALARLADRQVELADGRVVASHAGAPGF